MGPELQLRKRLVRRMRSRAAGNGLYGELVGSVSRRKDMFDEWRAVHAGGVDLAFTQCAGFRPSLFLGGEGEPENLEITDIAAYWGVEAQIHSPN